MKLIPISVAVLTASVGLCAGVAQAQLQARPMTPVLEPAPGGPAAPVIACFAQGTDPRYVAAVNSLVDQLNADRLGADYQLNSRWSGAQGTARALTWSFVPDGILLGSGAGELNTASNLFAALDAAYAAQGGRATWVNRYTQIFARWQQLSGITFTRITTGGNDWDDGAAFPSSAGSATRGDCRCGGHPIDGASNILAYCYFPSTGDSVMDTQDTGNFASSSNANRFIRNTVGHEFGHGLGLNHVDPTNGTKLMEAFLNTGFDGPQQDDIRAIERHYGDPYESNDTAATAKPLGAVVQGSPVTFGTTPNPPAGSAPANSSILSIDANGKVDFWSFSVNQPVSLTATATPIGSTYLQGPQGGATANVNALAIADLAIDVISTNGTTVLSANTGSGIGLAETASAVVLPAAGTYFLRVYETNSPTESQLYRLNLSVTNTTVNCPQAVSQPTGQNLCEGSGDPISLTFVANGTTPAYQWRKDGVNIPGAAAQLSNYVVASPTVAHTGSYDCVASNTCGSVTSDAVSVTVATSPGVVTSPNSQSVNEGDPVTFIAAGSGSGTLNYQWRKDTVNIGGATNPTYNIASAQLSDAGGYDCQISNTCEYVFTSTAILTVNVGQSCYANCDGSTTAPVLNANDFQCFLNAFAANDTYANCDGSTTAPVLNANDFQCFLNEFAAGCS